MAVCKKCGNKISFFDYNYDGLCSKCNSDSIDKKAKEFLQENKNVCNNCKKDLKTGESINGLFENCSQEENTGNNNRNIKETTENTVALILKFIAVLTAIIGFLYGASLDNNKEIGVIFIIVSFISAVFIYGFAEIIQKLENIENKL